MLFDYIKKFDKLDIEICEVYSCQSFEVKFINRVSADLENPKKVREFATEFQKSGNFFD